MTVKHLALTQAQNAIASKTRSTQSFSEAGAGLNVTVLDANGATLSTRTLDLTGATIPPSDFSCFNVSQVYNNCSFNVTAPSNSASVRVTVCPDVACVLPALNSGTVALNSSNFTAGAANAVSVTMAGVPASIAVFAQNPAPLSGSGASTIPLTVQVYDAEGAVILGPDAYPTPVTVTESDSTHTLLTAQSAANLEQQVNGQTPSPFTPPAPSASVSIASRYIQPLINYDGLGMTTTVITATIGAFTSAGLSIVPSTTPFATTYSPTVDTFPLSYTNPVTGTFVDSFGSTWVRYSGSATVSASVHMVNSSTFQPTGTAFALTPAGTKLTSLFITGPDGNQWATYCTPVSGTTCATGGFVKFALFANTFTYFPVASGVITTLVSNGTQSLIGVEQASSKLAVLTFPSPTTATEVNFAPPAGTTGSPAYLPAPQTIMKTGNGNMWVTENNVVGYTQTYITQVDGGGNKIAGTEQKLSPGSSLVQFYALGAAPGSSSTTITYGDNVLNGQLYTYNTATNVMTALAASPSLSAVPVPGSSYSVYDAHGNYWYESEDAFGNNRQMNRIDAVTKRVDTFVIQLSRVYNVTATATQIVVGGLNGTQSAVDTFTF